MKIVEFNPFNEEHKNLGREYNDNQLNEIIEESLVYDTQTEYTNQKNRSNNIFECIIDVENNEIKNHCIFTGTKDNRLIQLQVANLSQKRFLLDSINYAFSILNAHTITIFTDKETPFLDSIGFENLGTENDTTTYIMEKEEIKEMGSVIK